MGVIKIPIPIMHNGKMVDEVVMKPLLAGIIADTSKIMEKGDGYKGIQTLVSGGIEKIGETTSRQDIYEIVGKLPYQSAFYLAVKIVMQDEKDDGVEGFYPCPRCNEPKICEFNENPDIDSRDHLSDLEIKVMEDVVTSFKISLNNPIEIKDIDNNDMPILTLEFGFPTLNDCSMAFNKVGEKDKVRLQLQAYIQALKKINDIEVDNRWKNRYGMKMFEEMDRNDIKQISDKTTEFGLQTKMNKICNKCGKEFVIEVNTANFFVSALR
jgi:hypothetical protein